MDIPDGYTDVRPGKIASIVTYLDMSKSPVAPPLPGKPTWQLQQHAKPELNWYRALFRAVGQDWLWFSRLQMDDDTLREIIHDPRVDVFSFLIEGQEKGILELDRRHSPDIEL